MHEYYLNKFPSNVYFVRNLLLVHVAQRFLMALMRPQWLGRLERRGTLDAPHYVYCAVSLAILVGRLSADESFETHTHDSVQESLPPLPSLLPIPVLS